LRARLSKVEVAALLVRSTWNQNGNFNPTFAAARLYCILQVLDFVCYPFTRASTPSVDLDIEGVAPSISTLFLRSTWNQQGNCGPILATVRLYCTLLSIYTYVHSSGRC
jgi:hypothetical protein